jgi:hypothetical protein
MKVFRVLLPFTLAILCSAAEGQSCETSQVLMHFPGFHLLKLDERDANTKAFLTAHFLKSNPSVVHADFDGDGFADYALLLKNRVGTAKLVVVLCLESQKLRTVYSLGVSGSAGEVYLKTVPPGTLVSQTEAIDTGGKTSRMRLSSAGIRVVYDEKAEVVLFWNAKLHRIQEIQTAD